MFSTNDHIEIELETDQAPYRIHGKFLAEDDEYIKILGTVGDNINSILVVPKSRIKLIMI